ncbi:MAG TPA: SMP-30/gluconolactonase/LRE family protein [Bryobacteraceae bacterium]|nr:SMP-30/gluconolactonase/LRE family protein [Bryobacteraceae bacterium]
MKRALLVAAAVLVCGAQEVPNTEIARIAAGYRFTEGAAWSKDNYLIFSDTPHDQLLKWVPGTKAEVFREDAHGPAGNAFDVQGRLYTCETRMRRITRTDPKGRIETVADRFEGKRLNAPLALVVSKSGHIYFTDPAFGYQEDQRELDFYGVYHISPKGAMEVIAKPKGRPHGIALSPNGRMLYVANADERNIRVYDLDRNGEASGERVLVSGIPGIPGGISVDADGNLYVAVKGIAFYNAQGHLLRTLNLPDPASSCVLGDGDLRSLFVTARGFVYRLRLEEK